MIRRKGPFVYDLKATYYFLNLHYSNDGWRPLKDHEFRMSMAGQECDRAIYFDKQWKRQPPRPTVTVLDDLGIGAAQVGTAIHNHAEHIVNKKSKTIMTEERIQLELPEEDFQFSGTYDVFLLEYLDGKKYVVDYKTTNDKYWEHNLYGPPKLNHANQLHLYMHALGKIDGMVVYINRESWKIRTYIVKYDEYIYNQVIERFRKLYENHMVPKKAPDVRRWFKKWDHPCKAGWYKCQYYDTCLSDIRMELEMVD